MIFDCELREIYQSMDDCNHESRPAFGLAQWHFSMVVRVGSALLVKVLSRQLKPVRDELPRHSD